MAPLRQNGDANPDKAGNFPLEARQQVATTSEPRQGRCYEADAGHQNPEERQSLAFFLSLFLVEEIVDIGLQLFKAALFGLAAELGRVSLLNAGTGSKSLSKGMIFLDFMISIDVAADFTLGH